MRRRILLSDGGFGEVGDMTARGRKLKKVADVRVPKVVVDERIFDGSRRNVEVVDRGGRILPPKRDAAGVAGSEVSRESVPPAGVIARKARESSASGAGGLGTGGTGRAEATEFAPEFSAGAGDGSWSGKPVGIPDSRN